MKGALFYLNKDYNSIKFSTPEELERHLNSLVELGLLSSDAVAEAVKSFTNQQKKEALESHPYAIYQGDRGRWMTYIKDERGKRRLIAKSRYEDLENALVGYYIASKAPRQLNMTLEDLYPLWIKKMERNPRKAEYIQRISSDWNRFYKDTELVKKPVVEMEGKYVKDWVENLILTNGLNSKQYYNAITILKNVLLYAEDEGIIVKSPFDRVHIDTVELCEPLPTKTSRTEVYTSKEKRQFYKMAMEDFEKEVQDYVLSPLAAIFMFETGLRISEVCAIRYEDIDGSDLIVQRMLKRDRHEVVNYLKMKKSSRRVPLSDIAFELIKIARKYQAEHGADDNGYIFSMEEDAANYRSISNCFTKYSEKCAGVRKSSHKARKTYVSVCIDDDRISDEAVREVVGHQSLSTTYDSYYFDRKSDKRRELFNNALKSSLIDE